MTTIKWRLITSIALGSLMLVGVLTWFNWAREAARASSCQSNLTGLGFALRSYHQVYGSLPPAYVEDANGRRMHSWRALLLEFLNEEELYAQYRFDEPWDGPHNSQLADKSWIYRFGCPSDVAGTQTSYVVVVGPKTLWPGATSVSIEAGSPETLLVVEVHDSGISWMEPRDLEFDQVWAPVDPAQPKLDRVHSGTLHYVNAAGRARSIDPVEESAKLKELISIE